MFRRFAALLLATVSIISIPGVAVAANGPFSVGGARFLAVAAAVVSILLLGFLFAGPGLGVDPDVRRRLGSYAPKIEGQTWLARIPFVRGFALSAEEVARRSGVLYTINSLLEQANVPLRPGEALLGSLIASVLIGLIVGLFGAGLFWGVITIVLAILALVYGLQFAASRERTRFENQLPDTLNLLATSLRAGYSLLQALEAVAKEAPDPTAREFGRALSEIRLGQAIPDALSSAAERMGSAEFEYVVLAIDIQREVGGNLAEVLNTAADTMLARNRLRREARALTAEGRISAVILSAIPILLFAFLYVTNREYLDPLLDTTAGRLGLAGAGLLLLAGIVWLRKIVQIEV